MLILATYLWITLSIRIRVKLSSPRVFISKPASLSNKIATDLKNKYSPKADSNLLIVYRFYLLVPTL